MHPRELAAYLDPDYIGSFEKLERICEAINRSVEYRAKQLIEEGIQEHIRACHAGELREAVEPKLGTDEWRQLRQN
jgi:hypothetical protein